MPRVKRAGSRPGKITQKKGLRRGLRVDHQFRRYIDKKLRINPCNPNHQDLNFIHKSLKQRRIECITSQLRVGRPDLGIFSEVDAIGCRDDRVAVVIELKTTQFTLAEHKARYNQPCIKKRMLSNRLPNTEQTAHALQTGFGMLALKSRLPPHVKVEGLVIVCAHDGIHLYDVDDKYMDEALYVVPNVKPQLGTYLKLVHFQPLPTSDKATTKILKALKPFGYAYLTMRHVLTSFGTKYGSFTLNVNGGDERGAAYLVVALVHSKSTVLSEKRRKQLDDDAFKLWIDKKKKCRVKACCMLFHSETATLIHTVSFAAKSHLPVKA